MVNMSKTVSFFQMYLLDNTEIEILPYTVLSVAPPRWLNSQRPFLAQFIMAMNLVGMLVNPDGL